jgi:hypothetical protein
MRETPVGIGPVGSVGRMGRAGHLPAHTCSLWWDAFCPRTKPGRTSRRAERPPGFTARPLRDAPRLDRVPVGPSEFSRKARPRVFRSGPPERCRGRRSRLKGRDPVGTLVLADEVLTAGSEPCDECRIVASDDVRCLANHVKDGFLAVIHRAVWVCDAAVVDGVSSRTTRPSRGRDRPWAADENRG